eukprot:TRINITY_DN19177_c0_g1_i1.p1 TRINITY_DN19177_c0_g1~~TRINITY_DN19177_c0_g1_i1.p1  ORF type:complete len:464 (+),score=80.31 TRINITY_DN19177_c0_g1_i1:68-1459(+)
MPLMKATSLFVFVSLLGIVECASMEKQAQLLRTEPADMKIEASGAVVGGHTAADAGISSHTLDVVTAVLAAHSRSSLADTRAPKSKVENVRSLVDAKASERTVEKVAVVAANLVDAGALQDTVERVTFSTGTLNAWDKAFASANFMEQAACDDAVGRLRDSAVSGGKNQILHMLPQISDDKVLLRKLRLSALSFLATQDPDATELWIWIDKMAMTLLSKDSWKEYIEPVLRLEDVSRRVKVKVLHPDRLISELESISDADRQVVQDYYQRSSLQKKSDLARIVLLSTYGGTYVDADAIFLQDLSPVITMDVSWVHHEKSGDLSNSIMNVAHGSDFTQALLRTLAKNGELNYDFYQFGQRLLTSVWDSSRHGIMEGTDAMPVFHVLPACFFEGGINPDEFFTRPATKDSLSYFFTTKPSAFIYHWHNHWADNFLKGSVASCLEQHLLHRLSLRGDSPEDSVCSI